MRATYDSFETVEMLQTIADKGDIILDEHRKPTIIECLEYWGFIEAGSEPYPCKLTQSGQNVLENQKVKQFRRRHLFNFLSELNDRIEKSGNFVHYCHESNDGSLGLWTNIPYHRTVAERRVLDRIAGDMKMQIATKDEGYRDYIFKNERAEMIVHGCNPLVITVYPSKPISPTEKLITLLVERLGNSLNL